MADISKITLPDGTEYDIKDATAREGSVGIININLGIINDTETTTLPVAAGNIYSNYDPSQIRGTFYTESGRMGYINFTEKKNISGSINLIGYTTQTDVNDVLTYVYRCRLYCSSTSTAAVITWTLLNHYNTTYSAGTGLKLSGTQFSTYLNTLTKTTPSNVTITRSYWKNLTSVSIPANSTVLLFCRAVCNADSTNGNYGVRRAKVTTTNCSTQTTTEPSAVDNVLNTGWRPYTGNMTASHMVSYYTNSSSSAVTLYLVGCMQGTDIVSPYTCVMTGTLGYIRLY